MIGLPFTLTGVVCLAGSIERFVEDELGSAVGLFVGGIVMLGISAFLLEGYLRARRRALPPPGTEK
jgi:hypothetical protein